MAKHSSLPVIQKHSPFNWIYVNFLLLCSMLLLLNIYYAYNLVYWLSNGVNWFAMHLFAFSFSPFTITLKLFEHLHFRWVFGPISLSQHYILSMCVWLCMPADLYTHISLLSLYIIHPRCLLYTLFPCSFCNLQLHWWVSDRKKVHENATHIKIAIQMHSKKFHRKWIYNYVLRSRW